MFHRAMRRIARLFSIYAAYHLPEDSPHPRRARLRLMLPFAIQGSRALPHALRWARHRDPAARARVKQLLDLSGPAPLPLDEAIFAASDRGPLPVTDGVAVTIVMPVYGNLPLLRQALKRVAQNTDLPWRIVLIDDASPDPETLPVLRRWRAEALAALSVDLIELPDNLGFVGAVNRGLERAAQWRDPVVLLNTDALVPPGWASRLITPLRRDATVASVTPMSNDAELGSVPVPGKASPITPDVADQTDRLARSLNPHVTVSAPAGVGFCMALSRSALDVVPQFDMGFSPGYGEEVDWCQRLAAIGFRHVYAGNLFVAHIGGQSFGSVQKQALIRKNAAVITARYPRFDAEVHGFLRRDPLVTTRLALGIARAEAERIAHGTAPLTVYLAHAMGGGAETDLRRRVSADIADRGAAVILRIGGVFRVSLELWTTGGSTSAGTSDWRVIERLLAPLAAPHLIYSCAVGDPDPVALPRLFLGLKRPGSRVTSLIHDYFPISPNPTLLEDGEHWRGPPQPETASARHLSHRPDGTRVPLGEWQAQWGHLIEASSEVVCFSKSAQTLVRETFENARCVLRPHSLPVAVQTVARPRGDRCVLGLLGNLAPHKGAGVAQALSRALPRHDACTLVHLGQMDPAYMLHPPARSLGAYRVEDLASLAQRHGITCWLIPSLWPETFSFTTHEALATGLPAMVFDLGGQAEAVRAAQANGALGALLPLDMAEQPDEIWHMAQALSRTPSVIAPKASCNRVAAAGGR